MPQGTAGSKHSRNGYMSANKIGPAVSDVAKRQNRGSDGRSLGIEGPVIGVARLSHPVSMLLHRTGVTREVTSAGSCDRPGRTFA
jgi:hypothetical protein